MNVCGLERRRRHALHNCSRKLHKRSYKKRKILKMMMMISSISFTNIKPTADLQYLNITVNIIEQILIRNSDFIIYMINQ